jgi:hypothetical protein
MSGANGSSTSNGHSNYGRIGVGPSRNNGATGSTT